MTIYAIYAIRHNEEIEREINWSYTDKTMVKAFTSKDDAEAWTEANFVRYAQEDVDFCDFEVKEVNVEEDLTDKEIAAETSDEMWILATLNKFLEVENISGFRKWGEEMCYFDNMSEQWCLDVKLPSGLKTRKEVVAFLKSKVKAHSN